jgi:hypothetical protein
MVLVGSKVVATKRCRADWHTLDEAEGPHRGDIGPSANILSCDMYHQDAEAAVKKICAALIVAGYSIVRKPNWSNALCAIAPQNYDNVYFQTTDRIRLSDFETAHQVCLISATQLLCSNQALFQHRHGVDIVLKPLEGSMFPLLFEEFPQSEHFKELCQKTDAQFKNWCESYPTIDTMQAKGYQATNDYTLVASDSDSD